MSKWVITVSRHHDTEIPDWIFNINNKTKNGAILEAYKTLILEYYPELEFDSKELSPILSQENFCFKTKDEEGNDLNFFLWNKVENWEGHPGYANMGVGEGETIEDTLKSENMWFQIEERSHDNSHLALRGYQWWFDRLPEELLTTVLEHLDDMA